jgi:tryptophanase
MSETIETTSNQEPIVGLKEFELPSGRKASVAPFKGKHIKMAQRIVGEDSENIIYAIIALLTTIDGQPVVMEDMDEMPGQDLLKLMAEFGQANF